MLQPIDPGFEPPPRMIETASPVLFEYVGRTGLTATGTFTGRRYRFDGPGAQVEVDARDAPSLTGVPNLRRARPQGVADR
jgi:hypothetical protein